MVLETGKKKRYLPLMWLCRIVSSCSLYYVLSVSLRASARVCVSDSAFVDIWCG